MPLLRKLCLRTGPRDCSGVPVLSLGGLADPARPTGADLAIWRRSRREPTACRLAYSLRLREPKRGLGLEWLGRGCIVWRRRWVGARPQEGLRELGVGAEEELPGLHGEEEPAEAGGLLAQAWAGVR